MSNIPLIYQIFDSKKAKLLEDLYRSESQSTKKLIQDVIASQLSVSEAIVINNSLNQLILLMNQADFIESEEEPVKVGAIIFWGLRQQEILPKVTEFSGLGLGSRCLISLSMFEESLRHLHKFHAAPSPSFYRDIGKATLQTESFEEVSHNFDRWTEFIHERFV